MKSKKKKILLSAVIFIFIVAAAIIVRYFVNKRVVDVKDVVSIEINESGGNGGFIAPSYFYKIDFNNNTVTEHVENPMNTTTQTDSKTTFTEADKSYFIKYANYYGFFNWKESYDNDCYDMKSTNICITFKDGTQKNINCYGKFSLTYEKMKKVFEKWMKISFVK